MKVITYFAVNFLTIVALIVLSQVPLLQDLITASGYPANEVWGGLGIIAFVIYTLILAISGGR